MKNMTSLLVLSAVALSLSAVACGDDGGSGGSGTTSSSTTTNPTATTGMMNTTTSGSTTTGNTIPDVPTLGNQLDRMGRPAINTATIETFSDNTTRGMAEDEYNADANQASWGGDYAPVMAGALGILDSLDATCGNQPAAGMTSDPAAYGTLASVLANDYLVVKGDATEGCGLYLGVEAAFLGVENDTCGGRTPADDVIGTTYSIVAGVFPAPFDDTITAPSKSQVETFPYLAPAR
jgi:hypothetical protein